MLSTLATAFALSSLSLISTTHAEPVAVAEPAAASTTAHLNAMTYVGCFSSSQPLTNQGSYTYQTSGYCQPICVGKNNAVLGLTGGSYCWCGDEIPAASSKVDDSKCNSPCTGYGQDDCGGDGFWSVYLTGTEDNVGNYGGSESSSAASSTVPSSTPPASSTTAAQQQSTTSAAPSVVTSVAPGRTVVVTMPAAVSNTQAVTEHHESSNPNVAGIAAGVVVGVVAVAAIAGGLFFFFRNKRRREAEEAYRKSHQESMNGAGMPPGTGHSSLNDSRLDPEAMMQRRLSDGSIADNQDYSRRILRVANPDGS
ncbi:Stress-activated PKC1-MPK1 kinase pathway sensor [Taxawa tesnikishii (nom. ined.)]|nr:Stress-activated PKC1-MPK1 kinase pathway sensor [Dothideales sp. JES 119]